MNDQMQPSASDLRRLHRKLTEAVMYIEHDIRQLDKSKNQLRESLAQFEQLYPVLTEPTEYCYHKITYVQNLASEKPGNLIQRGSDIITRTSNET